MTLCIVSVVLALAVSALCSLLEATLLSLTPTQVAEPKKAQAERGLPRRGRGAHDPPRSPGLRLRGVCLDGDSLPDFVATR